MLKHGHYVWHPQRSREIPQCFIVSSVAKDHLVLSQYDLHHGSFLLVTPLVMSSYKSTITHCKRALFRWRALLSKLGSSKENSHPPGLPVWRITCLSINLGVTSFGVGG